MTLSAAASLLNNHVAQDYANSSSPLSGKGAQLAPAYLQGADVTFTNVSNDTRTLTEGALYVAIRGENFDGHAFLDQAQHAGAIAAMVDQVCDHPLPQLVCGNTRLGLGKLAAGWRQQFKGRVVGITGSNGKTTVKEMLAAILAKQGAVLATRGNYNNDIGLPLTLLRLKKENFAVIEMGANHIGEIDALTHIARPDVAVITNAGQAHLEGFGSLEGVSRGKGEIYGGLNAGGVAVINADDVFAPYWFSINDKRRCLSFGMTNRADIQGVWEPAGSGSALRVSTPEGRTVIQLPVPGRHNAMNALASIAASAALGISLDTAGAALAEFAPVKGRLNFHRTAQGACLIDDTYNANPSSFSVGLQVLVELPGEHWLVMGDMGELGDNRLGLHTMVGEQAKQSGVHCLLAVGENSRAAVAAFGEGARYFSSHEALIAALLTELKAGVNVLVKGSRFMRMERVVNAVINTNEGKPCC